MVGFLTRTHRCTWWPVRFLKNTATARWALKRSGLAKGRRTGIDQELVGNAGVVHIVNGAGEHATELVEIGEHRAQRFRVQQNMCTLKENEHSQNLGALSVDADRGSARSNIVSLALFGSGLLKS